MVEYHKLSFAAFQRVHIFHESCKEVEEKDWVFTVLNFVKSYGHEKYWHVNDKEKSNVDGNNYNTSVGQIVFGAGRYY